MLRNISEIRMQGPYFKCIINCNQVSLHLADINLHGKFNVGLNIYQLGYQGID